MPEMAFVLLAMAAIVALVRWRYGLALCVLTAILQDPLRKLTPGQPVYFVVLVGVTFGAAWVGALMSRVPMNPGKIVGWRNFVGLPFALFIALALMQAAHSLIVIGNPILTAIGMLSYFAPIPAIVLAYQFALRRGVDGITGWMTFYVLVATLALTSVYLEYIGFSWRVLGEVGEGVLISGEAGLYKGNSGFFRAAEIAAWHAATIACFSFILIWGRRFSLPKVIIAVVFIVFLLGIGALTARRKMIIEIAIFISSYICLVAWFQRGRGKLAVLAALAGVIAYIGIVGMVPPDPGDHVSQDTYVDVASGSPFGKYSHRAKSVFADIPARLNETGIQPVSWAYSQFGWFGAGLGVGSQGTQHFGTNTSGAAEGGLGKVTVELGVPGLLLVAWLAIAFGRYVWRLLGLLARASPKHANMAFGFVGFMLANVAAFSVATQAYADVFILLTLGWALGFLLALPVLAARATMAEQ